MYIYIYILQVVYNNARRRLVEYLLEVQQPQKSSKIEDKLRETKVTDDRQRILQAFQISSGVSFCCCMLHITICMQAKVIT